MAQPTVDAYPTQFATWQAAGGVEDNFRMYMLGTKQIAPTAADTVFALNQTISRMQEVAGILEALATPAPAPAPGA